MSKQLEFSEHTTSHLVELFDEQQKENIDDKSTQQLYNNVENYCPTLTLLHDLLKLYDYHHIVTANNKLFDYLSKTDCEMFQTQLTASKPYSVFVYQAMCQLVYTFYRDSLDAESIKVLMQYTPKLDTSTTNNTTTTTTTVNNADSDATTTSTIHSHDNNNITTTNNGDVSLKRHAEEEDEEKDGSIHAKDKIKCQKI